MFVVSDRQANIAFTRRPPAAVVVGGALPLRAVGVNIKPAVGSAHPVLSVRYRSPPAVMVRQPMSARQTENSTLADPLLGEGGFGGVGADSLCEQREHV